MDDGVEIAAGNRRALQVRARINGFDARKRMVFLKHFAATGNATASAKTAGVAVSTTYMRRARDALFRAQWAEALDQGYARLEAELVRRASAAMAGAAEPIEADETAANGLAGLDAKFLLSLLEFRRRGLGAGPGDRFPQRSDLDAVRARLEKKMRALGLLPREGDDDERAAS